MKKCEIILEDIKAGYTHILQKKLIGIYVHGSIAFDCFNWETSDIDYLVVVAEALTAEEKRKLMRITIEINKRAPQKGLEMSVVLKEHCLQFCYPTPFELHFSNAHLGWYCQDPDDYCEKMRGTDPDLAAHFSVIRDRGIKLCGEKISDVFSTVDKAYFLSSIKSDIEEAGQDVSENPVYLILTLCRVKAYMDDGVILSKSEGGKWGLANLPVTYHGIIHQALAGYHANGKFEGDGSLTSSFCDYMLGGIRS